MCWQMDGKRQLSQVNVSVAQTFKRKESFNHGVHLKDSFKKFVRVFFHQVVLIHQVTSAQTKSVK